MPDVVRLIAARVLAGFLSGIDVANAVGISKSKYQKLESGTMSLNPVDRAALSALLDVSDRYLAEERIETDHDMAVARIAGVIQQAELTGSTGIHDRLTLVRTKRGFRSARSAATSFGWNEGTYGVHERGTVPIPVERAIGYALGFGIRPEYLIFGHEPMEPTEREAFVGWVDRRGMKQKSAPGNAVNWRWLKKQSAQVVTLPLVEIDASGRLAASSFRPAVLPSAAFEETPVSPYGIVTATGTDGMKITVVDPSSVPRNSVLALLRGRLELQPNDRDNLALIDPLSISAKDKDHLVLGSPIRNICIA